MKCHYVNDHKAGRVLIPYCYSTIHSDDIEDCTCPDPKKSYRAFEKVEYRKKLKEMGEYIEQLEDEIKSLNQLIKTK